MKYYIREVCHCDAAFLDVCFDKFSLINMLGGRIKVEDCMF